ncbi:MAG: hypothetical protein ACOX8H_13340 [Ruminococcus sp.]|jgi:hypothetical protein
MMTETEKNILLKAADILAADGKITPEEKIRLIHLIQKECDK